MTTFERAREAGERHRRMVWRYWRHAAAAFMVLSMLATAPVWYTVLSTRDDRYGVLYNVPHHKVAIVFGAGVLPDGEPTPYLKNRIETGVVLYKAGIVDKLLLSGDNRTAHYNEPVGMGKYAEQQGVPRADIVLDYAGYSTYDTCYRAQAIFGLHDAVLVSHGYHLPRAMTTCNHLGVRSVGVAPLRGTTPGRDYSLNYLAREVLSTDKAMIELLVHAKPAVLGVPEPIN